MHDALDGRGSMTIVAGEPGVGKTLLLDAYERQARSHRMTVFRATASPIEGGRAFASLLDALDCRQTSRDPLRAEIARLAAAVTTDADAAVYGSSPLPRFEPMRRFAAQDALVELVCGLAETPMSFILDDIQWADQATVAALAALARVAIAMPIGIVIAGRLGGIPAALDASSRVTLAPLDAGDLDQLVDAVVGAPPGPSLRRALSSAAGNPFLVLALLRELNDAGAVTVSDGLAGHRSEARPGTARSTGAAVLRRVGVLPADAARFLRHASIIGREFDIDDVAHLVGSTPTRLLPAVRKAVDAGLLDANGPLLAFRHDLVREAIEQDLDPRERRGMHRSMAMLRIARGASPSSVVGHLLRALAPADGEILDLLRRAAAELQPLDPSHAVQVLDRAAEAATAGSMTLRAIEVERVNALHWAGRIADAEAESRRLVPLLAGSHLEADARIGVVVAHLRRSDFTAALLELETIAALPGLTERRTASIWAEMANLRRLAFDTDGAIRDAATAIELADQADVPEAALLAYGAMTFSLGLRGETARSIALAEESVARAAAKGLRGVTRGSAHLELGLMLVTADRFDEAIATLEESRSIAEQARDRWMVNRHEAALLVAEFLGSTWGEVASRVAAIEHFSAETGSAAGLPLAPALAGLVAFRCGQHDDARARLRQGQRSSSLSGADFTGLPFLSWLDALLAEHDGDVARAASTLGSMFDVLRDVAPVFLGWIGQDTVRLHLLAGDRERAGDAATHVHRLAARIGTRTAAAVATACRARIEDDRRALRTMAELLRTSPRRFDAAVAAEAAGLTDVAAEIYGEICSAVGVVDASGVVDSSD